MKNAKTKWIIAGIFVAVITIFLLISGRDKPPVKEIGVARVALKKAKNIEADRYATKIYQMAVDKYNSAMQSWSAENDRFFLFRNYEKVRILALEANELALIALGDARTNSDFVKQLLDKEMSRLESRIESFQKYFGMIPVSVKSRDDNNAGILLFNEAKLAFRKQDYLLADKKLMQSLQLINKSYADAEKILHEYFRHYHEWQTWAHKTVESSRRNKHNCIIIDKFSRECILYSNGLVHDKFKIELGKNWLGDKNQQGDNSTPEGFYRIEKKLENGQTRFHKALLLDYPNQEDKARFARNQKEGTISADASIGSLIEIHGHGGKGTDWTNGCIALTDSDMNKLFPHTQKGMPVTIVGSIKPLHELIYNR